MSLEGKTPEEWVDEIGKSDTGGATAEDAEELAATMNEAEVAVAEAAAVVAEEVAAAADDAGDDSIENLKLVPSKRLSLERKEKLEALGFVWSLRSKRIDDHWDDMFRQLEEFKAKHGVSLNFSMIADY